MLALLLLVPAPTIGVLMLTFIAPGTVGQIVWGVTKFWLLAFPVVWILFFEQGSSEFLNRRPVPARNGLVLALLSGAVIAGAILGAYFLFARDWIDVGLVRQRIVEAGFAHQGKYLAFAIYTCTVNAMLEEYVWRWFVFRKCEQALAVGGQTGRSGIPAVLLSAALFTIHHIVALVFYFDWRIATLGTIGVFLGGAIWSWFYLRYRSVWPGYVSHVCADIAMLVIGWWIIFE
jgi:membrane protease YdiL (CAAX protease family)